MKDEIIKYHSDESAKFVEGISGWVDRRGRFWGEDEHMARYSGSTHRKCKTCEKLIAKNSYCRPCANKSRIEKYNKREKLEWDGETPIYSEFADRYFFNEDELMEYVNDDRDAGIESLRLIICKPYYLRPIDENYFYDELSEDAELPEDVLEAIETLNHVILKQKSVSWEPGKYAAILK